VTLRRRRVWLIAILAVAVLGALAVWLVLPTSSLGFAGGGTVPLADYQGPSPVGVPPELRSADLVTRGAYLTRAADCVVCHTATGGQPFAGGLPFPTPFGLIFSPNITADPQTGIGTWSDAEFIRALHEGVRKDGQRLYPAFPYESYTLITDDDARAIRAYLFSLPTVRAAPPPNQLAFPFSQRWLMGVWSAFYNPNRRFRPYPDRSPEWNRGAYLAEALGHCGDCHTPRNLAQAPDNRAKFQGAVTEGWRAFNITPDRETGVGAWSDADLAQYLQSGHAAGHGSAGGPMADIVDQSIAGLTPGDVRALVAYVRSVPPRREPGLTAPRTTAAAEFPHEALVGADLTGQRIFAGACASCHGWSGVSQLNDYATLTGDRTVSDPSAINVAQIIVSGAQRRTADGMTAMPAFGAAYSDSEIAAVANYVTRRFGAAPSHITAKDVARLRRSSHG